METVALAIYTLGILAVGFSFGYGVGESNGWLTGFNEAKRILVPTMDNMAKLLKEELEKQEMKP